MVDLNKIMVDLYGDKYEEERRKRFAEMSREVAMKLEFMQSQKDNPDRNKIYFYEVTPELLSSSEQNADSDTDDEEQEI